MALNKEMPMDANEPTGEASMQKSRLANYKAIRTSPFGVPIPV
jgi:hypothetical protein